MGCFIDITKKVSIPGSYCPICGQPMEHTDLRDNHLCSRCASKMEEETVIHGIRVGRYLRVIKSMVIYWCRYNIHPDQVKEFRKILEQWKECSSNHQARELLTETRAYLRYLLDLWDEQGHGWIHASWINAVLDGKETDDEHRKGEMGDAS